MNMTILLLTVNGNRTTKANWKHCFEKTKHYCRKAGSQFVPQLVQSIHNMNLGVPGENTANATPTEQTGSDDNADCKPRYWLPSSKKKEASRSPVVCTHDLMEWSYQIACGMNYLTKRKVFIILYTKKGEK